MLAAVAPTSSLAKYRVRPAAADPGRSGGADLGNAPAVAAVLVAGVLELPGEDRAVERDGSVEAGTVRSAQHGTPADHRTVRVLMVEILHSLGSSRYRRAGACPLRGALRNVSSVVGRSGEIAAHFDVTRPAISQHLNVLKEVGLVSERRDGTRRLYQARPEGFGELKAFLEGFWDERLDALRRAAERKEGSKNARND